MIPPDNSVDALSQLEDAIDRALDMVREFITLQGLDSAVSNERTLHNLRQHLRSASSAANDLVP